MKKLLTLALGVVLFSGAAAAKLYWLPDYQNEDMKARDRVFDDDTNRSNTCANDGRYDSPLSSNCYNCSASASSSHKVCYSCTAKPVPAGQVTKAVCYAKTNGSNGWIWTSSGICSGTEIYGTCTAKTCDSSYQTSATLCRTTGAYGWTLDTNDKCYAGATTKYKCKALTCPSGYSKTYSDVSKCGSKGSKGWSWEKSSQYAGNSVCGKCRKLSCNSPYTPGVKECSTADGYTLKQDSSRYNGDTVCGYCQVNDCSGKTKQSDCNTSNGYTFTQTCKSGTTIYGTCKPNVCSGTKKSDCNTANGYIFTANCKSAGVDYGTCKAATCPTGYSTSYQSVANCGSTGSSGWTFSSKGKSGGKVCGKCTAKTCSSCKTSVASCGSSGSKGWTLGTSVVCTAGNTKCYSCSKKSCSSGVVKSACDTASGAKIWTAISGIYSGNDQCGKCEDAKKDCRSIVASRGGAYVSNSSEFLSAINSGKTDLYLGQTSSEYASGGVIDVPGTVTTKGNLYLYPATQACPSDNDVKVPSLTLRGKLIVKGNFRNSLGEFDSNTGFVFNSTSIGTLEQANLPASSFMNDGALQITNFNLTGTKGYSSNFTISGGMTRIGTLKVSDGILLSIWLTGGSTDKANLNIGIISGAKTGSIGFPSVAYGCVSVGHFMPSSGGSFTIGSPINLHYGQLILGCSSGVSFKSMNQSYTSVRLQFVSDLCLGPNVANCPVSNAAFLSCKSSTINSQQNVNITSCSIPR